jgi:hypothetical protein
VHRSQGKDRETKNGGVKEIEVPTVFVINVTKPQELESSEYFKVVTFLENLQRLPI